MRIEATTSSVASVLPIQARGGIEDGAASPSAVVDDGRRIFVNPKLLFDDSALALIVQIRDLETGDVTRQFPSREVVERYRRQVEAGERGVVTPPQPRPEPTPDVRARDAEDGEDAAVIVSFTGRGTDEADTPGQADAPAPEAPALRVTRPAVEPPATPAPSVPAPASGGEPARTTERSTVV